MKTNNHVAKCQYQCHIGGNVLVYEGGTSASEMLSIYAEVCWIRGFTVHSDSVVSRNAFSYAVRSHR